VQTVLIERAVIAQQIDALQAVSHSAREIVKVVTGRDCSHHPLTPSALCSLVIEGGAQQHALFTTPVPSSRSTRMGSATMGMSWPVNG
jgi:hypothetical protein